MEDDQAIQTKLLTLLNVSASRKRKRSSTEDLSTSELPAQRPKLNQRKARSVQWSTGDSTTQPGRPRAIEDALVVFEEKTIDLGEERIGDPYNLQFSSDAPRLVAREQKKPITSRVTLGKLGSATKVIPEGIDVQKAESPLIERLQRGLSQRQESLPPGLRDLQNDLISTISTYQDTFLSHVDLSEHGTMRDSISLHGLNHVLKIRRRVLKNNERMAHAAKDSAELSPSSVQDQGFTRPSVLFLLPFRSTALTWLSSLLSHTPGHQVENRTRFMTEFGLPAGATDKLAEAALGVYPADHVTMFKGNVDDAFRVGVKMTRKSVKLFSDFYSSDIILASPLGLRMIIEKEKNADFLSSIEVLVVDQLDALTMQNWDHVQFVFSHLNKMPSASHDADFSRIKPWYLDEHGAFLRQTVLLSAYETPEMRSLFNTSLHNVAGKIRTLARWQPVSVPAGVSQKFTKFDCANAKQEAAKRFEYFTNELLPNLLKSAVLSSNTVIFVPSSFDFIRLHRHLKKDVGLSVAVLADESSNQDISRARQAFFSGTKSFLLVTERFHFYRRYKLRGVRNIIFYAPPDHRQFYTEFLSFPFLDEGVEPEDVTCQVLYSKYDFMRLERIAGSEKVAKLINSE